MLSTRLHITLQSRYVVNSFHLAFIVNLLAQFSRWKISLIHFTLINSTQLSCRLVSINSLFIYHWRPHISFVVSTMSSLGLINFIFVAAWRAGMGCVCRVTGVSEKRANPHRVSGKKTHSLRCEKAQSYSPWTHFIPNLLRLIATETEFLILNVLRQRRPQHLTH